MAASWRFLILGLQKELENVSVHLQTGGERIKNL